MRCLGWVLACVGLLVACGDDDAGPMGGMGGDDHDAGGGVGGSGSGGGSADVWTWEQYLEHTVEAICIQNFECAAPNDDQLGARSVLRTMDRCRTYYRTWPQLMAVHAQLGEAISAGRLLFDGAKAAACAARHLPCEPVTALLSDDDPCQDVLVGGIALGGECYGRDECAGSAYCASDDFSCPGRCVEQTAAGEPCDRAFECEGPSGSATCDGTVEPNVCAIVPFLRSAPAGQPCGRLDSGDREFCAPGLWCDGPFDGQGTCRAPLAMGQACDADTPCEGLAFCDGATDTCQEITVLEQVGAPCDEGAGIVRRMCDPLAKLICVNGACEIAGDGGENSRCVPGDLGDASCQSGFYCEWATHVCLPLRQTGDPCSSSQECAIACDYSSGLCSDRLCAL